MYGLIYGADGADYPDVDEAGPYETESEALAAVDYQKARRLGGVILVREFRASDGESVTTGSGMMVREVAVISNVRMAAVAQMMDDELREQLHSELAPCTHEEFLRAYRERCPAQQWAGMVNEFRELAELA